MPPLKSANYIRRWAESVEGSRNSAAGTATFPFAACLTALEAVGVRTDYDLLLQPDTLVQTPVVLHHHIKALRMAVLDHLSSPGHSAADLIERHELTAEQPVSIKSGIVELDRLLNGGLSMRQVTELCAKEARVATQVAIEFATAHLLPGHASNSTPITKVYYLQSGSLSLWRAEQAISKRLKLFSSELRDTLHRQALERLIVVDCGDADALLTFLHKYADARAAVNENQQASLATRDLVIVDSIRPLIVAVLQRQNDIDIEVHAVKTALRRITSARSLVNTAVLVTNGVSQRENSRTQPSLGTAWGMVSHTHLYLDQESLDTDYHHADVIRPNDNSAASSTGRISKILAVVLKSPCICVNSQAIFELEV
ncbi:DNA repair protein rad51d [Coemansia aciculifera]|nr:DNA repair protein rad51d [Coemansia aciculifera]